jgi:prepilin-type N-terminal cleavage/methylation domain-containing protein
MFRRQRKAFTLIELMISFTIISILTCIAIPSLIRAKINANETSAVASIKAIQEAEEVFFKNDWYKIGTYSYANFLDDLCVLPNDQPALITSSLATARAMGNWYDAPTEPNQGYLFNEISQYGTQPVTVTLPSGQVISQTYGVIAAPAGYLVTGQFMFAGDNNSQIWMMDPLGDFDLTQHKPLTLYNLSDMSANGWQPYQ